MPTSRARLSFALCSAFALSALTTPARADAACDLGASCAGIGVLVRHSAVDAISCTAFLVGPSTLLTARHCIEEFRRDGGTTATSRYRVRFAATDAFPEEAHDAHVLRLAPLQELSVQSALDWALLGMDAPTRRPALTLASGVVPDGSPLEVVWAAGPDNPTLTAERCRAVTSSLFAPHVDSPDAPVVVLAGCDVRPGQSGAPVLGADGRVVAIVKARDGRRWPTEEPLRFPRALRGARQLPVLPIAYATRVACVGLSERREEQAGCDLATWQRRARTPGQSLDARAHAVLGQLAEARARIESELSSQVLAASRGRRPFVTATHEPMRSLYRLIRPDGASPRIHVEIQLEILVDEAGAPVFVERRS